MGKLRIGVFGVCRGTQLAESFVMAGCEIVAICDRYTSEHNHIESCINTLGKGIAIYTDFDEFIDHDMDAVILANAFHEHAPYAIKCFEKGLHVFSECNSNVTMAEGVAMIRAFEKSKSVYMLAENYPQMKQMKEMERLCKSGKLGKILYAEGDYDHFMDPIYPEIQHVYMYNEHHWRNWCPKTYYITHALGPLMKATGATPVRLTAFASFAPETRDVATANHVGDRAAAILTQNDDGSVFRLFPWSEFGGGPYSNFRFRGQWAQVENYFDTNVSLRYSAGYAPDGEATVQIYDPVLDDPDKEIIEKCYFSGRDYLTVRIFLEAIREGRQPEYPFDIYSAVLMSSVAILGWRSVLEGGKPYDVPDFRKEEDRKRYENDNLTPFWGMDGSAPTLPCSSHPDYKPDEALLENYRKLMKGFQR